MSGRIHYTACPVCSSSNIQPLLTVKDYTVSMEEFVIWQCASCTVRFTQDVPDAASIGPYYKSPDYISHTNTREGLLNKLYQKVRKITLQQKANLIIQSTGVSSGKILDIGCGTGAFLHTMKEKGWHIEGVEPDAEARSLAGTLYGLTIQEPEALFRLQKNTFDAITLWHVLEHVHDLHSYMDQLHALLRQKGKLFIAVPNYQSFDQEIYRLNWAAYDVPRHLYHFTPRAMETLLQLHRFRLVQKKPMWFDSFYVSLLSSKYRNGKRPNWFGAGMSGLRSNLVALANKNRCSSLIYLVEKV